MSDDLRSRCIIAMRDVIGGYAYDHLGNPEYPFEGATAARLALDAMLSCLTENADEWAREVAAAPPSAPSTALFWKRAISPMLGVLREDR